MLVPPRSRMTLIAVLRRAAMTCGPEPVRTLEWVLTLGDIAHPVQAVLDRPVRPDPCRQKPRVGVAVAQGGDRVDGLHRRSGLAAAAAPADDLDRAGAVRKQPGLRGAGQIEHLDRAGLSPAVADGPVAQPGRGAPGQPGQGAAQPGREVGRAARCPLRGRFRAASSRTGRASFPAPGSPAVLLRGRAPGVDVGVAAGAGDERLTKGIADSLTWFLRAGTLQGCGRTTGASSTTAPS